MNTAQYNEPDRPSKLVYFNASRFFKLHNGKRSKDVMPIITLVRKVYTVGRPNVLKICEKESPIK